MKWKEKHEFSETAAQYTDCHLLTETRMLRSIALRLAWRAAGCTALLEICMTILGGGWIVFFTRIWKPWGGCCLRTSVRSNDVTKRSLVTYLHQPTPMEDQPGCWTKLPHEAWQGEKMKVFCFNCQFLAKKLCCTQHTKTQRKDPKPGYWTKLAQHEEMTRGPTQTGKTQ